MFEFKREIIHHNDTPILSKFDSMREYYKLKHDIAEGVAPTVIAEIGVRAGYSGWAFLNAAPTAKYYALDANNGRHGGAGVKEYGWWDHAKKILSEYNTVFTEVDTQAVDTLTDIIKEPVDFFHVDGDHSEAGVQHDLDLALEVLSPKGAILVDDITYIDGVTRGVNKWLDNHPEMDGVFIESLRGEMLITQSS